MENSQELQARIEELTAEIEKMKSAVATGIETHVPPEIKQMILIMGAAAFLKKPWLLAVAFGVYFVQKKKKGETS